MTSIGKALLAGSSFVTFMLIFVSNAGMLPLGMGDFLFLTVLSTLAALYRPGWVFLALVSVLPFEAIILTPDTFPVGLRPYQILEVALIAGLFFRFLLRRPLPQFPKPFWFDGLILLVVVGSFLSLVNAPDVMMSLKISLVLCSLFLLYILGRIYLQSVEDVKKILPFIFVSGGGVLLAAIFENIRFLSGLPSFQVMPGRPDASFPEPDWLGLYLVVLFGTMLLVLLSWVLGEASRWKRASVLAILSLFFAVLLMTVARSAWLGAMTVFSVFLLVFVCFREQAKIRRLSLYVGLAFFVAVFAVSFIPLSRFDLFGRAASTGGLQEITVSCEQDSLLLILPKMIRDTDELAAYHCRHIMLEEIGTEEAAGRFVSTVFRVDPNIEIRKGIYRMSIKETSRHPFLGIGWGSIGATLGTDANGSSLNASNMFLEVWLGSGLLGLTGFFLAWFALPFLVLRKIIRRHAYESFDVGVLSVWAGITLTNLFNSGILLGFIWIFLSVAALSVAVCSETE